MIFYHPQLMPTAQDLWLYLVSNPIAFERYEDHEAALQIWVHELVDMALEARENVTMLIEDTLNLSYDGLEVIADYGAFILNTDLMSSAFHRLEAHWNAIDDSLPDDSVVFASGTSKAEAQHVFPNITLRTYLEALARIHENQ